MKGRFSTGLVMCSTHPAAAAAAIRLDLHRVAKFPCNFHGLILCLDDSIASRRHWHTGFARSSTSSILVAHRLHRAGGGAYELDVAAFADLYEMRVLGKKPVARMNGVDIADLGGAHDPIDPQITFQAEGRADADRFIGKLNVQRIDICFRIDG